MKYVAQSELNQKLACGANCGEQEEKIDLIKQIENLLSGPQETSHLLMPDARDKSSSQSLAGKLYSSRRAIDAEFGMDGFASSPAWDIMLDLIQSEQKARTVSVTSACIAAACPSTTALRWLKVLVGMSLIETHDDQDDKGLSYVTLTPKGRGATLEALRAHI